jgi:hypothetical protein
MNQLGSLLPERMTTLWDRYEGNPQIKEFFHANRTVETVRCMTLASLLRKHEAETVDFLQMDVEGYEYEILQVFPFEQWKPTVINYERVLLFERGPACRMLLSRHGYSLFDHGLDTLAVQESKLSGAVRFRLRAMHRWMKWTR